MAIINTIGFPADANFQKKYGKSLVSNSLTLGTSLADVLWVANGKADSTQASHTSFEAGATTTAWIDTHNAPSFDLDILWTFASGTILDLMVWGTNDINGVIARPLGNIPAGATDGNEATYPTLLSFPKGSIAAATGWYSGSGTTLYCGCEVFTRGKRWIKLRLASDNASGSAIAYASPGASS